ncbi:hypothetical protein [Tumebacillus flagellatus]|uniref:Uncharacterized protein n=1 Tax=Tumebacillus flagellatus TaxID=1157490 RepID=A0A074LI80_9BACL|nr:hypothetical protein [Tumebacillus flagellatus]KEO80849.1 hypothetical protein EL26_24080 [Tumebacillus flagellatus]
MHEVFTGTLPYLDQSTGTWTHRYVPVEEVPFQLLDFHVVNEKNMVASGVDVNAEMRNLLKYMESIGDLRIVQSIHRYHNGIGVGTNRHNYSIVLPNDFGNVAYPSSHFAYEENIGFHKKTEHVYECTLCGRQISRFLPMTETPPADPNPTFGDENSPQLHKWHRTSDGSICKSDYKLIAK